MQKCNICLYCCRCRCVAPHCRRALRVCYVRHSVSVTSRCVQRGYVPRCCYTASCQKFEISKYAHATFFYSANKLQIDKMADRSNKQAFDQSQRDVARLQQFGKVMESKAISDGQRNKYTAKLKELRSFLHDFEQVEEDACRDGGAMRYKKTHPYRMFVPNTHLASRENVLPRNLRSWSCFW